MTYSPYYITLYKNGILKKRYQESADALSQCSICPRKCNVNRMAGETGFCRSHDKAAIASHNLHFGEEPPITGTCGSGTLFFSGCNMQCTFCQNYPISQHNTGSAVNATELAQMMLTLQSRGAHNINLVTATHVVPQFLQALYIACEKGLSIPIVYNCSGYESMQTLTWLDGIIDIYMPDIKYACANHAQHCSNASDYWAIAQKALIEMFRQKGCLQVDEAGIATSGMMIRHLILPNNMNSIEPICEFVATQLSEKIPFNLMSQYFPAYHAVNDTHLSRQITQLEFDHAESIVKKWNLINGWIQYPDNTNRGA